MHIRPHIIQDFIDAKDYGIDALDTLYGLPVGTSAKMLQEQGGDPSLRIPKGYFNKHILAPWFKEKAENDPDGFMTSALERLEHFMFSENRTAALSFEELEDGGVVVWANLGDSLSPYDWSNEPEARTKENILLWAADSRQEVEEFLELVVELWLRDKYDGEIPDAVPAQRWNDAGYVITPILQLTAKLGGRLVEPGPATPETANSLLRDFTTRRGL